MVITRATKSHDPLSGGKPKVLCRRALAACSFCLFWVPRACQGLRVFLGFIEFRVWSGVGPG